MTHSLIVKVALYVDPMEMSDLDEERRRLLYRAMHRGFKEADIVVGQFAQANLAGMSDDELSEFTRLLDVPDQELYAWVIGRHPAPDNFNGPVLQKMQAFDVSAAIRAQS